jgi:hypothetical protein
LLDGLHAARRVDDRHALRVECVEPCQFLFREMPCQIGYDLSGVQREGANSLLLAPLVQSTGEQDVSRLGLSVGYPFVIGAAFEIDVLEIDTGNLVSARGYGNDAGTLARQSRPEMAGKPEMAEMVCRELRLMAGRVACRLHNPAYLDKSAGLHRARKDDLDPFKTLST